MLCKQTRRHMQLYCRYTQFLNHVSTSRKIIKDIVKRNFFTLSYSVIEM